MEKIGLDPNMTAYERHLWQVLAALGRGGYYVPPQDARDLIHDFYVEDWEGLVRRYDSNQSQFGTYLAAAFYRFARRRIIRLERWRRRTVDLEDAAELESALALPDELVESSEGLAAIRAQLAALPPGERGLLMDFLASGGSNERALAERHGLTRYRVRETLANAVGRVMVALADVAPVNLDARVAKNLWVDGLTPRQVASLNGIDTKEVNVARLHFVAGLMKALRQFNHPTKTVRKIMNADLNIVKTALLSVGDVAALRRVRAHADAISAAFAVDENDITFDPHEAEYLASHPKWVSAVYAALGGGDAEEEVVSDVQLAIAQLVDDETREIGESFSALVEILVDSRYPWTRRFEPLRGKFPEPLTTLLLQEDATIRYAGACGPELLKFGLTPAMIYGATRGLYLQLSRLRRALSTGAALSPQQANPDGAVFCLVMSDARGYLSHALARAGIAGTKNLPKPAIDLLLGWICDVIRLIPGLIEGYTWEKHDRALDIDQLSPVENQPKDLYAQWGRRQTTHEALHRAVMIGKRLSDA